MYVIISVINSVLPLLIIFLLWRFLIGILRSVLNKGGQRRGETEMPEEPQEASDLAAEIERKLRQKKKTAADIVTDSRLKVYSEPVTAVYTEQEQMSVRTAVPVQEKRPERAAFSHQALVNGFIMSEILGKPRSIKPYDGSF